MKPFLFGVRAVERNKILRSRNSWAGGTVNSAKKGLGLPIPIGPHKGTGAVERFHIAEPGQHFCT